MKKLFKLTALLLCMAMLMSLLAGCGFMNGGGDGDGEPTDPPKTDAPKPEFDPPYLENYYVNKHEPVKIDCNMEIYKYEKPEDDPCYGGYYHSDLWMGGHIYHGGFKFWGDSSGKKPAQVDLPLYRLYENISFVIGGEIGTITQLVHDDGNITYPYDDSQYKCSPPTLIGKAGEMVAGVQFWVDDKLVDEVLFSNYQVPVRYTYNVSGAEKFSIKTVAGDMDVTIPVMEITVWEGEAHETGPVTEPAGSEPVQLIKDLKPYMIPAGTNAEYYPNVDESSEGREYINMAGIRYENVISTYVSQGLVTDREEPVFFNLEGKYKYLTFTAGVADRTTNHSEGSAWLTVYADGKIIHEEVYSSHELQRKTTISVEGCHQLKFTWLTDEGNLAFGDSTGNFFGIGDAYVATTKEALDKIVYSSRDLPNRPVKMVSELGAFAINSAVEKAVFDGSTKFNTFSMGGVKYNEGLIMRSTNSMLQTLPANASFNLDGQYKTISFKAGHISNSNVYENDQIEIYADGVLIKTIDMKFHMIPQEYVVDVTGCKHLEFVSGKLSNYALERPAYGIVEMVAYPDGYVETDLFPKRTPADFGESCDLIDTFGFYDVYNSHISKQLGAVSVEDGYYDGTTNKNIFTVGNKTYNKGILLKTNIHLELDMSGIAGASVLSAGFTGGFGFYVIALAGAGEAHESAFAMANIKDSGYTSVTFTVAMQKDNSSMITQDETKLMIGADDECVWETTLYKGMEPTTFTVEFGECDRLMFWLNCGPEDNGSHTYAIYDITLNK